MKILQPSHAARDPSASGAPIARPIASGDGWSLAEYVCGAGPGSPSFEERHGAFTVAAVLEGLFRYRTDTGTALLHPGALLLGNFGTCFECGHDHSRGDRCVALHLAPEYFGEIAASASGSAGFRFRGAMLPAHAGTLPWFAHIGASLGYGDRCEIEETAIELIETVAAVMSGHVRARRGLSAADEKRISAALRVVEQNFAEPILLDQLAAIACMSKYHFLRTFRSVVGVTPHRYLLGLRLRNAALRLVKSSTPISAIAFDTGFGDLSTFNARFRRQFGISPSGYRARWRERRTHVC